MGGEWGYTDSTLKSIDDVIHLWHRQYHIALEDVIENVSVDGILGVVGETTIEWALEKLYQSSYLT